MKYTVAGYLQSTGEVFTHHVDAEDPDRAAAAIPVDDPADAWVVAVFEGHLQNVWEGEGEATVEDLRNL